MSRAGGGVLVCDASVLIAHLDEHDAHHTRAGRLLGATGDLPLITSVLTHGETLVGPTRVGTAERVAAALRRLGVTPVALPADAGPDLARLRGGGLKMPDCCVLVTALRHRPAAIATFDDRLAHVAAEHGIPVLCDGPQPDAAIAEDVDEDPDRDIAR